MVLFVNHFATLELCLIFKSTSICGPTVLKVALATRPSQPTVSPSEPGDQRSIQKREKLKIYIAHIHCVYIHKSRNKWCHFGCALGKSSAAYWYISAFLAPQKTEKQQYSGTRTSLSLSLYITLQNRLVSHIC